MRTLLWTAVVVTGCGSSSDTPSDARPGDARVADVATPDAQTCVETPGGLRARYRGENNANDHTGKYNGTVSGFMVSFNYRPGKHGMAFEFDGLNHAVTIEDDDLLWPSFSLTLEAWVQTSTTSLPGMVVCKYECGGLSCPVNGAYFCLGLDSMGKPVFELKSDEAAALATVTASSSPVNDGAWHHLVAVRDGTTQTISLYVDGLLAIASNPAVEQFGPMTNRDGEVDRVTIGGRATNVPTSFMYMLAAAIDEVAIYHQPLTAAEVSAIYKAPDGKCL